MISLILPPETDQNSGETTLETAAVETAEWQHILNFISRVCRSPRFTMQAYNFIGRIARFDSARFNGESIVYVNRGICIMPCS